MKLVRFAALVASVVCLSCLLNNANLVAVETIEDAENRREREAYVRPTDDPDLPNVLLIGDSISIGYTPYVQLGLAGKADVFRIPGNGKYSEFGLENLDKWIGTRKWDVIHFNWGLWDLCYRNLKSKTQGNRDKLNGTLTATPEQYGDNLEKIVARLKKTGAKLIWCATTPVPEHEAGRKLGDDLVYNAVAEKVMIENGVAINDLHSHALAKLPEIRVAKGDVHFTKVGYEYLAEKVVEEISSVLDSEKQVDRVAAAGSSSERPNVVLIFADDLGYGDLGCYGATKVQTPNIDRLAREGRRFTDAHSVSAVCTPSRYALLTGQYPLRATGPNGEAGIWGPSPVTSRLLVDPKKTTIADVFKRSGYETAAFGKWHLGFGEGKNSWEKPLRPGPQDLGFDYYFGMPIVNSAPPYVYVENDKVVGSDPDDPLVYLGRSAERTTPITPIPPEAAQRSPNQFGGAKKAHELFNDYEVGTTIAERSVKWIEERKDSPFFLYLATTNIHHPFTPAKRFQGTSQCGLYGDFIHELDWIVGEILTCLEDNGLSENTLVVFTSDNGGMFNLGGQTAFKAGHRQNGDLLGFKFGVWEGGHRVPMIVRWPGKVEPGTTSDQLIGNVDMLATFAAVTRQTLTKDEQADSANVLPAFIGEPKEAIRDHLVLAPRKGSHLSLRKGKWMYIPAKGSGGFGGKKPGDHGFGGPPAASFVGSTNSDFENGKIKQDAPRAQLYDLEADLIESKNLYEEHPEVVKELSSLLETYRPVKTKEGSESKRPASRAAKRTSAQPSSLSVSWDFESGKLEPWKVIDGKFGHVIGNRDEFFRNTGEYNKQGEYYLTTLEPKAGAAKGMDSQTGVIVSPLFVPRAGTMTFRVGGGRGKTTYVALCTADGKEVGFARGVNDQVMQNAEWDLSSFAGKKLFLKIVDKSTVGWGHITADDFQFDGEVLDEYPSFH